MRFRSTAKRWVQSTKVHLARRLRRWAEWMDPTELRDAGALPVPIGQIRWEVRRVLGGRKWSVYDGPDGAAARKRWEHVKRHKEAGRMEFVMDGQVRDTYMAPTE